MALDFYIISLKKDSHNRHYTAEIIVDDKKGKYEIYTSAHVYFYDWLDGEGLERLSILNGDDRTFNSEFPRVRVEALEIRNRKYERSLEKAILRFIKEECSEKT